MIFSYLQASIYEQGLQLETQLYYIVFLTKLIEDFSCKNDSSYIFNVCECVQPGLTYCTTIIQYKNWSLTVSHWCKEMFIIASKVDETRTEFWKLVISNVRLLQISRFFFGSHFSFTYIWLCVLKVFTKWSSPTSFKVEIV